MNMKTVTRTLLLAAMMLSFALSGFAQKSAKKAGKPAAPAAEASSGSVVLSGGKLLTISHGVIENGVIIMEGGKITAVGAAGSVTIPKNARVIDVKGMTVYPGLIDSNTHLGLTEISAVDSTNDTIESSSEIMPHMHVYDAFHAETELIPVTRMNGVTNAIVAPAESDTLPGQMSFIQLNGRNSDEMLMVRDIALPLNFTGQQRRNQSFATSKFPSTRMGMAAELRQTFLDAQDYSQKWADYYSKLSIWEKKPASSEDPKDGKKNEPPTPPKRDLKLEALGPYLQGKRPVVITAEESSDLKVALGLAREFNLKAIIGQATYTQNMLDEIAASHLPVIVGSIYDTPKNNDRYDTLFKLPGELGKRGVKIAFASYDSHQSRNLPYAAGYAVAYGLPYEEALKAITLNPAEIWGLADQLGSLDVGKSANIVVADGDPLELKTDVKRVFIGGQEVPMESRQTQLRDAYMKR